MVEPLIPIRTGHGTVQGKIVFTGTQVHIVIVRTPLHLHSQQIHVEMLAGRKVFDIEGNVMESGRGRGGRGHR
jgi:hypothetical protein